MPILVRSDAIRGATASHQSPGNKIQHEELPWFLKEVREDGSLCHICARLNLPWLFENEIFEYSGTDGSSRSKFRDGINLGSFDEISGRRSCDFCSLLVHTMQQDTRFLKATGERPDQDIWLSNEEFTGSDTFLDGILVRKGPLTLRLVLYLTPWSERRLSDMKGMIQRLNEDHTSPHGGLKVTKSLTELVRRIRDWIHPCLSVPRSTKAHFIDQNQSPVSLRLIDTKRLCVVGPLCNVQYFALSYTWGKINPLLLVLDNELELRKEGALRRHQDNLPKTIQDSITLCAMLGQNYLWVDSLCIIQDAKDKQDQIEQMDRIYQEASVTIIAATGKDGNAGIPGVSGERPTTQRITIIGKTPVANVLPSYKMSISTSEWNSRGWTFQENLLSTRKLIFTTDQVYFQCPHGECSEDTNSDIHETDEFAKNKFPWRSEFRLDNTTVTNWYVYKTAVETFCRRKLSYESDALNAFSGIGVHLSKTRFLSTPFVTGIPLCSLAVGLMWRPTGPLHRRCDPTTAEPMFPSWSWVAWRGLIHYGDLSGNPSNDSESSITRIRLLGSAEGTPIGKLTPEWEDRGQWKGIFIDAVHYIRDDLPGQRFAHPIHTSMARHERLNMMWSHLDIEADIAKLKITGEHVEDSSRTANCNKGSHKVCYLQVFDQNDQKAGKIIMDGTTFEASDFSSNNSLFTFIKITQTTLFGDTRDPAWDQKTNSFRGVPGEPAIKRLHSLALINPGFSEEVYEKNVYWCLYNVLVVVFEKGIARRIAVGQVHIHAFDSAEPTREKIKLG